jgi:hypothetical protein
MIRSGNCALQGIRKPRVAVAYRTGRAGRGAAACALAEIGIDLDGVTQGCDGICRTGIQAAPAGSDTAPAMGTDCGIVTEILGLLEHTGQLGQFIKCILQGSNIPFRRKISRR